MTPVPAKERVLLGGLAASKNRIDPEERVGEAETLISGMLLHAIMYMCTAGDLDSFKKAMEKQM